MDRLHRLLAGSVGLLALLALTGMIALWPGPIEPPEGEDPGEVFSARIVAIDPYTQETPDGFGLTGRAARIDLELLTGPDIGEVVRVDTTLDGYPDFAVGDRVKVAEFESGAGPEYSIYDFERGPPLLWLGVLFVLVVLGVGGWHGLRALVGLGLSLVIIVQFVVPAILVGESPFAVAFFGALAVMLLALPLAHGINPLTGAAIVGTTAALGVTILLGIWFIDLAHLTGYSSEDATMLRFSVPGIDPKGLVLAGLIIAALGVLDDVTVSQASTVFALRRANPALGWRQLFGGAMKVGRDHIASTVNTLVLAYTGASLALLVLFSTSGVPFGELLASEVLAEEIVKTLVGSIGLISAVPLTTALAASLAVRADVTSTLGHGHVHGDTDPGRGRAAPVDDPSAPAPDDKDFEAWINSLKYGSAGPPPTDDST